MSTEVREELDRIDQNIANTYNVLEQAGAEMPQTRNSNNLPETAASISAVLYGKKQNLTEEQKAQARENVGAVSQEDFDEFYSKVLGNEGYTNLLFESTETDRVTIFNGGNGYKTGVRLSGSSGAESSKEGYGVSGFIAAKVGQVLRIKNIINPSGTACYVIAYNASNAVTGYLQNPDVSSGYLEVTLTEATFGAGFNAVRLSFNGLDGETIVTLDQEIVESEPQVNGASLMFISPDGNDSNDGLTAAKPKKTVKACVNMGATRISAKRGIYNEIIQFWDVGSLEIFPTDNDLTYAAGVEREPIVFDTSDSVAVSSFAAYNSIKRVAYSNANNTQFDKVFIAQSQPAIIGDGYGGRYNSTIWLMSSDEKTVCIKLKPVLTVAECEAETNTFTYVGGYIYINANWTNVEKVIVPTNWGNGIYINGADYFALKEVEVRFAGTYNIDIRNCAYFDFYKCACKYTSYGSGFHPFNSNGRLTACYATKNFDGYGISGYGHTTYIDCVSEFNFDDGMSHHNATTGTVIGGRYEGNGKGGNVPAYGAKVNIYGGLYKDNVSCGIGYLWATDSGAASGMVQGAVMVGNPVGLAVNKNCDVIAMNCIYKGNTTDVNNAGNLVEYNPAYVKSVNGIKADENGNVKIEVSGGGDTEAYKNVLPLAIDTDKSVYNGTGYKNGFRLNSSAAEKEAEGCGHTGFIEVHAGETVRMKNYTVCQTGYHYVHNFNSSFTKISTKQDNNLLTPDENGIYTYVVPNESGIAYIRISIGEFSADTIITIDEEIV